MKAWYFDATSDADPRSPCQLESSVSRDVLLSLGVEYYRFDADNHESDESYAKFKRDRNYNYQDIVTINRKLTPGYDKLLVTFLREHIHDDEELRAIVDGNGYFDVRDKNDKWIRIEVEKGDLMVMPAGIYHRFMTTHDDHICAIRLFSGRPVWTAFYRDTQEADIAKMKARIDYLNMIK